MADRLCNEFTRTGKCKFGARCRYTHPGTGETPATPGASSSGARSGHPRSPAPRTNAPGAATPQNVPRCPPNVCRNFWGTKTCQFNKNCRYEHRYYKDPAGSSQGQGDAPVEPVDPKDIPPCPPTHCKPFWATGRCQFANSCRFRHEYFAKAAGDRQGQGAMDDAEDRPTTSNAGAASGADAYVVTEGGDALAAGDALGMLRRYLRDDYRFEKPPFVYGMMKVLSSASSTNKLWNEEEGQLLLAEMVSENGLLRLSDIINWPDVSLTARLNSQTLSFQRGFVPVIGYLASDFVVKSSIGHRVNTLYMVLINNFEPFIERVSKCIEQGINNRSFKDPGFRGGNTSSDSHLFASLATVLFECLNRFKNILANQPALQPFTLRVHDWFTTWADGVSNVPTTFPDPFPNMDIGSREGLILHIRAKYERISAIVNREQAKIHREPHNNEAVRNRRARFNMTHEGHIAALLNSYDGPGTDRTEGPRHDNDHVDIAQIRIAPTNDELKCRLEPFLPGNFHAAPHPLEAGTMDRLLDIQFRLLREELTAPLRTAVQLVLDDLQSLETATGKDRKNIKLLKILDNAGGRYRGEGADSVMFSVYTNIYFDSMIADRRGMSSGLSISAPPAARQKDAKSRIAFWERAAGKRLMQGGLVALVWKDRDATAIYLATVSSSGKDIASSAKFSEDRVSVRLVFFDPEAELRILQVLKRPDLDQGAQRLLIEAPVMFEAIRPFLEALRVEPETLPFREYLVHHPPGYLKDVVISAPAYARQHNFKYQLASLFDTDAGVPDLKLDVKSSTSVDTARRMLREKSRLDVSQADAVIDTLTREVSLIQGPPGTGKSYTGVELLRVLLANKVGPVLLIALTNHALDHLLSSVLEKNITSQVVRLGSRSADETVAKYSLDQMEMIAGKSRLDRTFGRDFRAMKGLEEELKDLMQDFLRRDVHSKHILSHIEVVYPEEYELLVYGAPLWVDAMHRVLAREEDGGGKWETVGSKKDSDDKTLYAFWRQAQDLRYLQAALQVEHVASKGKQKVPANKYELLDADEDPNEEDGAAAVPAEGPEPTGGVAEEDGEEEEGEEERELQFSDLQDADLFFLRFDIAERPQIPVTDRNIDDLLAQPDPWTCSAVERERLHAYWADQVRLKLEAQETESFKKLREQHAQALQNFNEGKVEVRRQLLKNVDIIGATTTGASKLIALLKGVAPRILLVEEAGQVLEAHILASLVPSIEHLICIGDPLQLRPTLNNYSLSMDNKRGAALFRFDMSLMERLSSELAMSQIDVQRRMRPAVSSLIRNTLYPKLQDHELVTKYPSVHGLTKNVFFLHHENRENGDGDESSSKYNTFEVAMVKDLVLYLLRQGCYSKEGDIVVLCAYLGQLARLRDALAKEVAVLVDERDEEKLAAQEDDSEVAKVDANILQTVERVQVSRRVRLRTVDNYQGEEGEVVILSLVRNSGPARGGDVLPERVKIGFLQSENRTNVALSRAKQGLYILGNAQNLSSRSPMWKSVIEELEAANAVGDGLPVACHQHPDDIHFIRQPGELPRFAPDGGCLRSCDARLKCGHQCPFKCHSDDPHHVTVMCPQPCTRHCAKGHPCPKLCSDVCGDCIFLITNVELPCGHTKSTVPCHLMDRLDEVQCNVIVPKQLATCEHLARMPCSASPINFKCSAKCDRTRPCCGKPCLAACHKCQTLSLANTSDEFIGSVARDAHAPHPCEKTLFCGHRCGNSCSEDHTCTEVCTKACRQSCAHTACLEPCGTSCAPCQQPCVWACKHFTCPVPCGSVCARSPCDARCERNLSCGHQCPSVCGELCEQQRCKECASADERAQVVDLILYRTLEDLEPDTGALDELSITLACGHTFTVETLDGHCHLGDYYAQNPATGQWTTPIAPPPDFMSPPVCPTCRASITALRYGRVVKRANLDILETNVGSRMIRSLNTLHAIMEQVDGPGAELVLKTHASGTLDDIPPTPVEVLARRQKQRNVLLSGRRHGPLTESMLDPTNPKLHGAPKSDMRAWKQASGLLVRAYRQAVDVAATRSSHIHAWEAGFTALFNTVYNTIVNDPSWTVGDPGTYAMQAAQQAVGQPKPAADSKYRIKAVCATIIIRFRLAELAESVLEALAARPARPIEHCQLWANYVDFVLQTCIQDATAAMDTCRQSSSHRQASEIAPMVMRARMKLFLLSVNRARHANQMSELRQGFIKQAQANGAAARRELKDVVRQHKMARQQEGEDVWIEENLLRSGRDILDKWETIEDSLKMDTFYQPVTRDDQISIIKALNFGSVGHFYRCENGHPYVITECGGAMVRSACPECGAVIGGGGHRLDNSNSRDMELQALAREHGAANVDHWAPR